MPDDPLTLAVLDLLRKRLRVTVGVEQYTNPEYHTPGTEVTVKVLLLAKDSEFSDDTDGEDAVVISEMSCTG